MSSGEDRGSQTDRSGQSGDDAARGTAAGPFEQLGGEPTVDPDATDTGIGGTGGVDGATLGGLGEETASDEFPDGNR